MKTEDRKHLIDKMEGMLEHLKKELAGIRTARASMSLLDGIKADYYGTPTPVKQIASLSTPDARLITVQPCSADRCS
jgi:ribosome recycling factor